MPRHTKPLSTTEIKAAKPKARQYSLADGNGLLLRVLPTGTKTWLFNYTRPLVKTRSNIGLGTFPNTSLAEARDKASDLQKVLANGVDPKQWREDEAEKQTIEHLTSLEAVTRQWLITKTADLTPDYAFDLTRSLENHVFPKLGGKPLATITAPMAIKALQPLADDGKLELVRRLCQRLNMLSDYAVNTGSLDHNRLAGIKAAFQPPTQVNNVCLPPCEIPELVAAIEGSNLTKLTKLLMLFQLHTMARPAEAAGARWSELDLAAGLWIIPPERMKKRREHVVPLTDEVLSIVSDLQMFKRPDAEFLFPSLVASAGHLNASTVNNALKRTLQLGSRTTAHGFRATASTALNEAGFDADLIEMALAHIDKNTVRATYNRSQYIERRKPVMAWWSNLITGGDKPFGAVVPIRAVV